MTTKLMVFAGFCVAFAAGVVAGRSGRDIFRPAGASPSTVVPSTGPGGMHRGGPGGPGWLAKELNLSTEQQEQMRQIWSETARRGRGEREEQRRQYRKDREDAIAALVRPEDKEKYQQIQDTYTQKIEELDRQWRASFEDSVNRTKAILTPEQRTKYEELLKRNQWDHGPGGGGPQGLRGGSGGSGGPGGPGGERPSSRPGDEHEFGGLGHRLPLPAPNRAATTGPAASATPSSDVNR